MLIINYKLLRRKTNHCGPELFNQVPPKIY